MINRFNKFDNQQQQYQYQGRNQNYRQNESDDDGMYEDQIGGDNDYQRQSHNSYNNQNNFNTFNNQQNQYYDNQNQQEEDSQIIDSPLEQTPIQVMIRVRPQFNIDCQSALKIQDNNTIYINNNENVHQFKYSRVFRPSDSQENVFKYVCEPILQHALQGFNASFLVYGQTGTGKTHTMGLHQNNLLDEPGMIQHSLKFLFDHFTNNYQNQDDWQISMSFMQIYIEEIFDLLNPSGQKLQIREDSESNEVYVQNLITVPIKNIDQALKLIEAGLNYRMLGPQNMNQHSSRSHTILNVYIQQKISYSEYIVSNIAFVDLAGSERIKKSNSTELQIKIYFKSGIRMEEAKKINSSLSALSNVISLLGNSNQQYIPYRDSKLTRILQNCLNNQSKISIIGTIEPSEDNSFESYSTLLFASRCQDIQFLPLQNVQNVFTMNTDPQEEILNLKDQIKYYQNKLKKMSNISQDSKFGKSLIDILKKPYAKLSKNLKQVQINSQSQNKKNIKYEPNSLYQVNIPFEELTQMMSENKDQEFFSLFEQTFDDIFQKYGQLSFELEKQKEQNNLMRKQIKKNERDDTDQTHQSLTTQINTKLVTDIIEYYSGYSQSLINQLLESEQILDYQQNEIQDRIEEFICTTNQKVKDIVRKHQVKELNLYMENFGEQNYEKFTKLESYRVKQLTLQLKKIINDSNQGNSKMNTNIKDFLEKQKTINDKKFMVKQNSSSNSSFVGVESFNPGSVTSNRSNSINNTSQLQNNSNNKAPTNLKQMMNDVSMRKKQNSIEGVQGDSCENQENISAAVVGNNQVQKPIQTIHIQRVKILNEDLIQNDKNIDDQQNLKLTEKTSNINKGNIPEGIGKPPIKENIKISSIQYYQQPNQGQPRKTETDQKQSENHTSNTSSISNLSRKTDMYNTNDLSPIPQEQTLNTQLKSANIQKKNQKYSPFIDN